MAKINLEDLLREKGTIEKVVDYAFPFAHRYDTLGEARKLFDDLEVRAQGITMDQAIEYIEDSHDEYRSLLGWGKFADTADRVTSIGGAVIEGVGLFFGAAPGFIANGIEEGAEYVAKAPFLITLARKGEWKRVGKLSAIEGGTALVPVLGDAYDIFTNRYVKEAYEVIREKAKDNILAERPPDPLV